MILLQMSCQFFEDVLEKLFKKWTISLFHLIITRAVNPEYK